MGWKPIDPAQLASLMARGWSWREYTSSADPVGTLYILEDDSGEQVYGTPVGDEIVPVTGTANDVREGVTVVTEEGIITGEKEIPAYHTTEGITVIPAGGACNIWIPDANRYDYTKLQAIICHFGGSVADSVAADKVSINNNVYLAGETIPIATVTVDHDAKEIVLGIVNEDTLPLVIRYFSYKEEA